ncbi:coiled-coil domain-containing protein 96-like isoform X2 [Biomphalaria glabrata]|uniref:Coiled-coil domain-containing protein 96-like isoform X2 n=1 Tax=Biomphalaria glabrata TaxID=6526 RepID=A0A9W2ZRX7_BIOGL|nr:coiled-coil domain-containing protein 96-like isoform X2 [Biomphalaria glabrata]
MFLRTTKMADNEDSIAESEIVVGDESLVDIAKDDEEEETEAQQASEVEGQVGETTAEGADEAQEQLTEPSKDGEGGEEMEEAAAEEEKKEEEEGVRTPTPGDEQKAEEEDATTVYGDEAQPQEEQAEEEKEEEQVPEDREERTDSPLIPVEPSLSRQMSPVGPEQLVVERVEPTSPLQSVRMDSAVSDEHIMETVEEVAEPADSELAEESGLKREEIIEKYYEALAEKDILQQNNLHLQHKLAEYFKKKKADEKPEYEKNMADQDQRYLKYMAQLEDLRRQYQQEKVNYNQQIEDLKEKCQERKEKVDMERRKFIEYKQDVAMHAIFGRSGKPIPPKDIEQYIASEAKKEQEVVNVRLENIKLKNKLKKKEQQLKSKEELADGLHLIDFEQLKIENQTYNEKIEERNEELLKLRKKITSTVQVLTHLKEKLQFVQGANTEQKSELQEVEASLAQSRDVLSRTKQARDALRIDNQKLRQNSGLLGNEPLLRDFESQKDEASLLVSQIEKLQMKHAEMTLSCNHVRQKIDQAKTTME